MKVIHVVGARPNFMKAAPVYHALSNRPIVQQLMVHTGQHYDSNMSEIFFEQLSLPPADINLNVGSGSHARQTADIMRRFEPVLLDHSPDVVLVYGDVNSTVAAALVSAKLQIPVAHVEAGLRCFDRTVPEEINRLLTDQLADVLYTPSLDGNENLTHEGVPSEKIEFVGNVMIDTLVRLLPQAMAVVNGNLPRRYALVTLHRPSNVDNSNRLHTIFEALLDISRDLEVIFPVHPRTRKRLEHLRIDVNSRLHLIDPSPYVQFLGMQKRATCVLTDSGGIQEETTYLGVPCLTLRENTERPITVSCGTNVVIGHDVSLLRRELQRILNVQPEYRPRPPLWDGNAGSRIASSLETRFN